MDIKTLEKEVEKTTKQRDRLKGELEKNQTQEREIREKVEQGLLEGSPANGQSHALRDVLSTGELLQGALAKAEQQVAKAGADLAELQRLEAEKPYIKLTEQLWKKSLELQQAVADLNQQIADIYPAAATGHAVMPDDLGLYNQLPGILYQSNHKLFEVWDQLNGFNVSNPYRKEIPFGERFKVF